MVVVGRRLPARIWDDFCFLRGRVWQNLGTLAAASRHLVCLPARLQEERTNTAFILVLVAAVSRHSYRYVVLVQPEYLYFN